MDFITRSLVFLCVLLPVFALPHKMDKLVNALRDVLDEMEQEETDKRQLTKGMSSSDLVEAIIDYNKGELITVAFYDVTESEEHPKLMDVFGNLEATGSVRAPELDPSLVVPGHFYVVTGCQDTAPHSLLEKYDWSEQCEALRCEAVDAPPEEQAANEGLTWQNCDIDETFKKQPIDMF